MKAEIIRLYSFSFFHITGVEGRGTSRSECSCQPFQFSCPPQVNGECMCIPLRWRCDQDNDCGDNADEIDCGQFFSLLPIQDFIFGSHTYKDTCFFVGWIDTVIVFCYFINTSVTWLCIYNSQKQLFILYRKGVVLKALPSICKQLVVNVTIDN